MEISSLRQGNVMEQVTSNSSPMTSEGQVVISGSIDNISIKNECSGFDDLGNRAYSEKELKESLDVVNVLLKKHNSHAEYSMHDKFKGVIMIKFVDSDTGQVLQEVPPKKILDMIAEMCEIVGIMVDKKA